MLKLTRDVFNQITVELERSYPDEGCGLMLGKSAGDTRDITLIVPAENLNTERAADRFELDPAAWLEADELGRENGVEVVGIYHSHPDCPPKASQFDQDRAWEGYSYLIMSVVKGAHSTYQSWVLDGGVFVEEPVEVTNG